MCNIYIAHKKSKRILHLPQLVRVGMLFPPVGGEEGLVVALKRLVPEES
jgi:hypothetical protein